MNEAFDVTRSFKKDGRRYYPLLLRTERGRADDVVVDINPVAMKTVSGAAFAMEGLGNIILVFLMMIPAVALIFRGGVVIYFNEADAGFPWVPLFSFAMGFIFLFAPILYIFFVRKKNILNNILFDRRGGAVIGWQDGERVALPWSELEPHIEKVLLVHPAGGSRFFRLHLVSKGGSEKIIIPASGSQLSEYGVAESYRFLSDYMQGAWDNLPEKIELLEDALPSFWKRVKIRASGSAPKLDDPLWKKLLLAPLTILSFIVLWPLVVPDMVSLAVIKRPPEFSQADLGAAHWDGSNPPMPEALVKRIKRTEPDRLEKAIYGIGLAISTAIWVPFFAWVTWKLGTLQF